MRNNNVKSKMLWWNFFIAVFFFFFNITKKRVGLLQPSRNDLKPFAF